MSNVKNILNRIITINHQRPIILRRNNVLLRSLYIYSQREIPKTSSNRQFMYGVYRLYIVNRNRNIYLRRRNPYIINLYNSLSKILDAINNNANTINMNINTSKKCAVLIGINYKNSSNELGGCENDVYQTKQILMQQYKISEKNILVLTEKEHLKPTYKNIIYAINWLVDKNRSGYNNIWFQYSGHGYYVRDTNSEEEDGRDETIVTLDMKLITDDLLNSLLIARLKQNTNAFLLMDCCHSGTIFDLEYQYKNLPSVKRLPSKLNCRNKNIVCISGCKDNQTSADAWFGNKWNGTMTKYFLQVLRENKYNIYTKNLVVKMRNYLIANRFTQIPMLTTSKIISNTQKFTF